MNELVDFLRARLDEDAARQQGSFEQWHHMDCCSLPEYSFTCDCGVPARALAEVEAKRQLVGMFECSIAAGHVPEGSHDGRDPDEAERDEAVAATAEAALCLLALPYAGHPDYREEWKP